MHEASILLHGKLPLCCQSGILQQSLHHHKNDKGHLQGGPGFQHALALWQPSAFLPSFDVLLSPMDLVKLLERGQQCCQRPLGALGLRQQVLGRGWFWASQHLGAQTTELG